MTRDALLGAPRGADLIPAAETRREETITFAAPRSLVVIWFAPLALIYGLFFATFYAFLLRPFDGSEAAYSGRGRLRVPLDPAEVRNFLLVVISLLTLILLTRLVRVIYWSGTKSLAFGPRGVVARFSGREATLAYDAITTARATTAHVGALLRLDPSIPSFAYFGHQVVEIVALLDARGVSIRVAEDLRTPKHGAALGRSETILWSARLAWWQHLRRNLLVLPLLSIIPLLCVVYAYWLWQIWVAGDPLYLTLFWTTFATGAAGLSAIGLIAATIMSSPHWLTDLIGTLVITPQRIAWLRPLSGVVDRQISASDIVEANLVEQRGARGWIALVTRDRCGAIKDVDLPDLRDAEGALAAIDRMLSRRAAP